MNCGTRLSCDERKIKILEAVRKLFARKGLEGATTRELAKEAGVSEALLYKHYPSKEALYDAMLDTCDGEFMGELKKVTSLDPSTSTLATLVHFMVSAWINRQVPDLDVRTRLYLQSIMKDGEFARLMVKKRQESCPIIAKLAESIEAATRSGDIAPSPVPVRLRALFVDRLAWAVTVDQLPEKPAVDYGVAREKLIEHVVWYTLRGLGMKDESIQRHYNPKALALFAA